MEEGVHVSGQAQGKRGGQKAQVSAASSWVQFNH